MSFKREYSLKKRSDFLRVKAHGSSRSCNDVIISASAMPVMDSSPRFRVGYIVTKKIGCAVVRNRCKRRLREAICVVLKDYAVENTDYVFIAKRGLYTCDYTSLVEQLTYGIKYVNAKRSLS